MDNFYPIMNDPTCTARFLLESKLGTEMVFHHRAHDLLRRLGLADVREHISVGLFCVADPSYNQHMFGRVSAAVFVPVLAEA